MILSLYHNRNKMKNYQELSQKYFKKEIVAKLKQLSNLDYCQSAEDMQYRLEEINDILNAEYPEIEESEE